MTWIQDYQPAGGLWFSALLAALPTLVLLVSLGVVKLSAHLSAALALVTALLVALLLYRMPTGLASDAAAMGVLFGVWSVAWIAFHAVYFHNVTVTTGRFTHIKRVQAGFSEAERQGGIPAAADVPVVDRAHRRGRRDLAAAGDRAEFHDPLTRSRKVSTRSVSSAAAAPS